MCLYKYSYVIIIIVYHGSLSWSVLWGPTFSCPCKEQQSILRFRLYPFLLSKYIQSHALYDHAVV